MFIVHLTPLKCKFLSPLEDTSVFHAEMMDSYLFPFLCSELYHSSPNSHKGPCQKGPFQLLPVLLFHLGSDFALEPGSTGHHSASVREAEDILFLRSSRCPEPNFFPPPSPPLVKTQKFSDLSSQPQRPKTYLCVVMSQDGGRGAKGKSLMI